jgi:hypothetical protein
MVDKEKLIEYWNGEISIKRNNLKYHTNSKNKAIKRLESLKNQVSKAERIIAHYSEMITNEDINIAICEARIEALKSATE